MSNRWSVSPYRLLWAVVGVVVLLVVSFVITEAIGGIVLGLFLYYGTRPVYDHVHDYVAHRNLSAGVTLLTVAVPITLVLGYAVLVAYGEAAELLNSPISEDLRSLLRPVVDPELLRSRDRWVAFVGDNTTLLRQYTSSLFAWGVRLFIMIAVAYYLLRDGVDASDWARDTFEEYGAVEFLEAVDRDLADVYTGNMLTIALTGLIAATIYFLFNLVVPGSPIQYPILLGFLIGIGTLIPVVGMLAIYVPYTGFLVLQAVAWGTIPPWVPVAFFAITFLAVDTFPDIVLRAYVSKGDINMGLMMLSYVLGAEAFGWYGVFLGPVVLVVFLEFTRRVFPELVKGWSIRPARD